jgi:hypothetical protein
LAGCGLRRWSRAQEARGLDSGEYALGRAELDADKTRTKAELQTALEESFAICGGAFAGLTDARASAMVKMGQSGFQMSTLSLLVSMISHSNEQHGYMAVYLRLKGIVPPSTEAMNAGR